MNFFKRLLLLVIFFNVSVNVYAADIVPGEICKRVFEKLSFDEFDYKSLGVDELSTRLVELVELRAVERQTILQARKNALDTDAPTEFFFKLDKLIMNVNRFEDTDSMKAVRVALPGEDAFYGLYLALKANAPSGTNLTHLALNKSKIIGDLKGSAEAVSMLQLLGGELLFHDEDSEDAQPIYKLSEEMVDHLDEVFNQATKKREALIEGDLEKALPYVNFLHWFAEMKEFVEGKVKL